jgi:quinoprotein glucose dehydrogenase
MAEPRDAAEPMQSPGRGWTYWCREALGLLLIVLGILLAVGGVWLIGLGGSWYYLIAGVGLVVSGGLLMAAQRIGVGVYVLTYAFTLVWALWEAGGNGWALVPRLVGPSVLLVLVLLCIPIATRSRWLPRMINARAIAAVGVALLVVGVAGFFYNPHASAFAAAAAPPRPSTAHAFAGTSGSQADQQIPAADWPAYGGSDMALRYSQLDQINRGNVKNLVKVWTFHTGDLPDKETNGEYSPETTPIKVGDWLYLCSAKNKLIGLNAATGKAIWEYDPKVPDDAVPYGATCRGVAYYRNASAAPDELCAERIVEGTLDARLIEVDAATGAPCPGFGDNGEVDLWRGIGKRVPGWYGNVAAPTIVRGVIIMGGQVQDGQAEDAPSGVIRGYNALTGKLDWAWDMCQPDLTGEPPPGQTYTRGTPNMWTSAAGDEALGYVYVPLGNSSVDYYGANRKPCENEYNSSLVAIDVTTGKPVWRFQTVHYDIWDYDLGSQPTLVDVEVKGAAVPAVVLASKQGQIYVLDRRTGQSLFPVEDRAVPAGGIEAARLSSTQPFSGFHSVTKPRLTEKDMWGMSPLDQLWCRIQFRQASYKGMYTPPTVNQWYLEYPGYNGGSDWGSVAADPKRGILVVNYNNMANHARLIPRKEADKKGLKPIYEPHKKPPAGPIEYHVQTGAPYAWEDNAGWRQQTGLLCSQPPYGGLTAIDLGTGKTLWDRPLGDARMNGPWGIHSGLPFTIGTPNNGGAAVTAGGLIFIAASTDNLIRAIDIDTGKELWSASLPAGGQATPMTFEANGRQFVALMPGGHHFMHTGVSDQLIAWALPESKSP